jgi:hypothetical protein
MTRPSPVPAGPSLRPRRAAALALLLAVTGASGAALAQPYPPYGAPVPSQPYRDSWLAQQATPPVPGDRRGWADGQRPDGRWAERKQQEAEAIARFSPSQRREFFNARRSLERRQADQQISLLNGTERCLEQARGAQAVQTCLQQERQQRMQQRRQERTDISQLRQRFGLPALPDHRAKGGGRADQGRWGPRPVPVPYTGAPQSWQPRPQPYQAQLYHPLAWY